MGRNNLIKHTSRLMAVVLVLTLLLSGIPAVRADESGTCGDNLTWSLSAGTLTISGSGAMTNFKEEDMAPWYGLRSQIVRLVLPEGLTTVGSLAFYGCEKLTSVVIPDSVTDIGEYAFAHCEAMEMLDLGSVRTVGRCAFSDCYSLRTLRLPDTLESIGLKGFYRCESISAVTIPASVTSLGRSAFAYCTGLVSADIRASVSAIPRLLFYGCELLASVIIGGTAGDIGEYAFRGCDALDMVYHDGSAMSDEEIREMVGNDIPGYNGSVTQVEPSDTASSGISGENEDGVLTQENTTVTQTENSTVVTTTTTTHPEDPADTEFSAEITVTVEDEQGWEEVQSAVDAAMRDYSNGVAAMDTEYQQVQLQIYLTNGEEIDPDFLDNMAGRDVSITVMTANGSVWRINGMDLVSGSGSAAHGLSYQLTAGSQELCQELETQVSFALRFLTSAEVNTEVMIHLGPAYAFQKATLFQRHKGLTKLQTAVVDEAGYAHFYLGSVDADVEYCIAMNLSNVEEEAIVPDELLNNYGDLIRTSPIEYQITGRTSSWGMTISQVTWIMVGVLVTCVVVIGFVMYLLNKRKLRMGYIPDLDDEE